MAAASSDLAVTCNRWELLVNQSRVSHACVRQDFLSKVCLVRNFIRSTAHQVLGAGEKNAMLRFLFLYDFFLEKSGLWI